ncbi:MAG: DNA-directed RNA polymerase subunit omega [Firmicutes bacterium]|jgi:DNA-directed RNA polymerase subunit omega|nr:DNA-directed RNA polymerase subunit omega [Bacillota bacterium]MDH7495049.1 DNA-directed RNA polymerase subunit omega [Bacillota bacterium]
MPYPPLDAFANKAESRYALVVATAKRARQIMSGAKKLVDSKADKPVTIAMEEILAGRVTFEQPKTGVK